MNTKKKPILKSKITKPKKASVKVEPSAFPIVDITARKQAEEFLRESEKKYRALADNSPDNIVRYDLNNRILLANRPVRDGLEKMMNIKEEEFIGKTYRELGFPEELCSYWEACQQKVMDTRKPFTTEYAYETPDGLRHYEWRLIPELDQDGQTITILSQSRDITAHKQAEEALKESEEMLQSIFVSTPDAITVVDLNGAIKFCNQSTADIHSYSSAEQLIGKNFIELVAEEDRQRAMEVMMQVMMNGVAKDVPFRGLKGNGEKFAGELSVSILKDSSGNPSGFVGITKDITARVQADEVLRKASNILQTTSRMARVGGWGKNLITMEDEWSEVTREIHEVEPDFVPDMENSIKFYKDGASRERIIQVVTKCIETGEPYDVEVEFVTARGNERWVRTMGQAEFQDGQCIRIFGAFQDITERMQADEALRESKARLQLSIDNMLEGYALHEAIFDTQGRMVDYRFLEFNPAAQKISNIARKDIVGRTALELYPNTVEKGLMNRYADVMATGEPAYIEDFYYSGDRLDKAFDISCFRVDDHHFVCVFRDITERKQAEEKVAAANRQIQTILESINDAFFSLDNDMVVTYFNPTAEKALGRRQAEVIGHNLFDAFPEARGSIFDEKYSLALKKKLHLSFETYFGIAPYENWYDVSVYPHPEGISVYFHLITERKQADEALRKSEEKYRTVADFTYAWEAWRAPDGAYHYVSPSCERITGRTVAEFLADPDLILKIAHPDDRIKIIEHRHEAAQQDQKQALEFIFRINTLNGETRWISHSCIPVYGADGEFLGRRESQHDITERKQAEEALRLSELDLKEAQSVARIGNWKWDVKKGEVTWSDEMFRIFGIDKNSYSGRLGDVIAKIIHPDDLHLVLPSNAPAFAEKKPIEYRIILPDGSIRHIWAKSGDTVVDNEGNPIFLTGIAQDITERKRIENELLINASAIDAANLKLQNALAREKELARTDVLTGVNNRRHLFELAEREFDVATRYQKPLSVIMFDLDNFKNINDTFGHALGDQMLKRVTQAACAELRSVDIIGRYGGEEFVIILPMTDAQDAHSLAERIRVGVAAIRIPTEKGDAAVTLSIGIAETKHTSSESLDRILICADKAMYAAKEAGRNRTMICEE